MPKAYAGSGKKRIKELRSWKITMIENGYSISFGENKNVPNLIMVMVAQFCKYANKSLNCTF